MAEDEQLASFDVRSRREAWSAENAADRRRYRTCHGNLAWSQAQPLQCDYPQTPPSVGDYLTVADTLPDPAPGQGRYYVTAVHHQGETRFGRQNIGGTLAGRNPAALPTCQYENTMSRRILAVLMSSVAATIPALPSEPGQPLDCSDWELLMPGLTCSVVTLGYPESQPVRWYRYFGGNAAIDNDGQLLTLRVTYVNFPDNTRIELVRRDGLTESIVARVQDRGVEGVPDQTHDMIRPFYYWDSVIDRGSLPGSGLPPALPNSFVFDAVNGKVVIPLQTGCNGNPCNYSAATNLVIIGGFTRLLEVFQSYEPQTGLGFRVPTMPEGFPSADAFDTYTGDLATLPDWSQAQPLQCDFPRTPPSVGEYLTVADTLPDPAPGQGRYYVTAVHHQGETRFGRQFIGGVLSGRNPTNLPGCAP